MLAQCHTRLHQWARFYLPFPFQIIIWKWIIIFSFSQLGAQRAVTFSLNGTMLLSNSVLNQLSTYERCVSLCKLGKWNNMDQMHTGELRVMNTGKVWWILAREEKHTYWRRRRDSQIIQWKRHGSPCQLRLDGEAQVSTPSIDDIWLMGLQARAFSIAAITSGIFLQWRWPWVQLHQKTDYCTDFVSHSICHPQ